MDEADDLQPVGDDIITLADPLRLGLDLAGKPLVFRLPAAPVAPRLLGFGLIELKAELPVVEGRFAFLDPLALFDEQLAQGFCLLLAHGE